MIEQLNKPGVKDWYGDDLLTLQTESLEVLQSFFSRMGAVVIDGCGISANGGNWDIAAGIVGIAHADGYKLARFAGATNVALPGYLEIDKTTQTGNYGTGTDDISNTYEATFTAGGTPGGAGSPDYLIIPSPATALPARLGEGFARDTITAWSSFTLTGLTGIASGTVNVKVNRAARQVYIKGTYTTTGTFVAYATAITLVPIADLVADATIGKLVTPNSTQRFQGLTSHSSGTYALDLNSQPIRDVNMRFDPAVGIITDSLQGDAGYTVNFNAVLLLD